MPLKDWPKPAVAELSLYHSSAVQTPEKLAPRRLLFRESE